MDASLVKVPLRCLRDAILLNATRAGENAREVEELFTLVDGVVARLIVVMLCLSRSLSIIFILTIFRVSGLYGSSNIRSTECTARVLATALCFCAHFTGLVAALTVIS